MMGMALSPDGTPSFTAPSRCANFPSTEPALLLRGHALLAVGTVSSDSAHTHASFAFSSEGIVSNQSYVHAERGPPTKNQI
jgi:hypothetical protein